MSKSPIVTIIGGGLAGTEAAHQAAKSGVYVRLFEMRPQNTTPAHQTTGLGELVCSNSLKSASLENASGILKEEMGRLGSIVIDAAYHTRVPAGKALAVDRTRFSDYLTDELTNNPLIEIIREEATLFPTSEHGAVVIATGPLTSPKLTEEIVKISGSSELYFYDSISPIIDSDSLDHSQLFTASRYGTGSEEEGDYLNCPLDPARYYKFVDDLGEAEKVSSKDFEKYQYFESCLPIEVIAERGRESLRYGPMKPVGLVDPRTGKTPFAVLQLRRENSLSTMYNLVGFQTKLKYPEQRRIFRSLPGLEKAEFLRYGSTHRNTYIHSPSLLKPTLELNNTDGVFFAGQIVGVEGYVESAAMGIVAGLNAARLAQGEETLEFPRETSIGALLRYITNPTLKTFQPMNINFGLYPPIEKRIKKSERRKLIAERAIESIELFKSLNSLID